MRGHHHGRAGPVDAVEQLHDALARLGVEVSRGLVRQQNEGPVDEGAGHGDTLLLATRELAGQVVPLIGQTHQIEHLGHLVGHDMTGSTDHLEGEGHVLEHALVRQKAEILEDTADVATKVRHPPLRQFHNVAAGLQDLAGVRQLFAQKEAYEGRLSGPGSADEEDELALVDINGDVAQGDR